MTEHPQPTTLELTPNYDALVRGFCRELRWRFSKEHVQHWTREELDAIHNVLGPITIAAESLISLEHLNLLRETLSEGLTNLSEEHNRRLNREEE